MNGKRIEVDTQEKADANLKQLTLAPTGVWCPISKIDCRKECISYRHPKMLALKRWPRGTTPSTHSKDEAENYWVIHDSYCACHSIVGPDV